MFFDDMNIVAKYFSSLSDYKALMLVVLSGYIIWVQRVPIGNAITRIVKSKVKTPAGTTEKTHKCIKEPILSEVVQDIAEIKESVNSVEKAIVVLTNSQEAESKLNQERHDTTKQDIYELRKDIRAIMNKLMGV